MDLPTGTITFLFTDIEGSTKLWERSATAMQRALTRHDEILTEAIEANDGHIFKKVGDAFCAAFSSAPAALEAVLTTQRALCGEPWEEGCEIRVRIALHTGSVEERGGDYYGPPLNRVARLMSAGHGGQVLLSLATQELVRDGLPPGVELRDLGERRLKDLFRPEQVFQVSAPELPSSFPPLRTLDARRNNLPIQPTPLVGREREVAEVCERMRQEEVHLLTLTGPGGTGKTRLGLQAAADLAVEDFEGGAFFVPLAAITDADLFFGEVAGALGIRESGDTPLPTLLKEYLGRRELLLILDNFEQLLGAAPLVSEILAAAPQVKVLVTSRVSLGLYGEHEYAVPSLSVPDPRHLPLVETLSQYEAVRLFIERAGAAKADFAITNENAPAIAEICARLDGLPLAIELAAARVKLLPPKALLNRLGNRLKLLTGGAKNLPARQRTLRGAIEWSHELLTQGEKTLFARLAVFSGGRTFEAIEAVCDAEGDLPVDSFDGVSSLLDKSLLRREEGPQDEPRFAMLETIHEFAREKLEESGEAEEIKRLHAEYFLSFAEEAEPELEGPAQVEWMHKLEAEHSNLRAALSWAHETANAELGLRLGGTLWWFWSIRGYAVEGRRWLAEGMSRSQAVPANIRAKALLGLGELVLMQGECEPATESLERSLLLYREVEDKRGEAYALFFLGWVATLRGSLDRANELFEQSVALSRENGTKRDIGFMLNGLASSIMACGDYTHATTVYEESLTVSREAGDMQGISAITGNLGYLLVCTGEHEKAELLLRESLKMAQSLGDTHSIATCLGLLGMVALNGNDTGTARRLAEESLMVNREVGNRLIIIDNLELLAGVAGLKEEAVRAARLWGASETLREAAGTPVLDGEWTLREEFIIPSRRQLDEALFEEAFAEGCDMALEDAVAYALNEKTDV